MRKLSISLLVLMLGTAVLTGCSKSSDTNLQTKGETQFQWGLNIYENSDESSAEGENGDDPEAGNTEDSVKELENDVLLLELTDIRVKSISGVNVRSGPGTGYDKIGSLAASAEAVMTGICSNEWVRIDLNGDTGYVLMDYLESADPEVSLSELLDRVQSLKADGSSTGSDERSAQESTVQGDSSDESTSDESSADESSESSADQSSVSGEKPGEDGDTVWAVTDVNVRKGPKSSYDVLGYLKQGEGVKVLDSSDAWWWKIEFNGQEGYVSVQYLTTEKPE